MRVCECVGFCLSRLQIVKARACHLTLRHIFPMCLHFFLYAERRPHLYERIYRYRCICISACIVSVFVFIYISLNLFECYLSKALMKYKRVLAYTCTHI